MKTLYLYLHTHWDREWYWPFETFRAHLCSVIMQILDCLETTSWPQFYLDGQSIILDDVLEIIPELAPRLKNMISTGKLSIGPWYVLPDQMLVSGESLISNLRIGINKSASFGQSKMVGYCPDTFGHTQDLPRILKGFGIRTAVVWRGVPLLSEPVFWWQSSDGSRILTYHLTHGYYHTALHELAETSTFQDNKKIHRLASDLVRWVKAPSHGRCISYCRFMDGALCPVGGDHVGANKRLEDVLKLLSQYFETKDKSLQLKPISLAAFLEQLEASVRQKTARLTVIADELRDNKAAQQYERAYLLPGVLSTRLYLKRANRSSEWRLNRLIKPIFTILHIQKIVNYPASELAHAIQLLLKNHPHDSISGCSVDEVHREMTTRSAQLHQLLDALEAKAKQALAKDNFEDPEFKTPNRIVIINVGSCTSSAPVRLTWMEKQEQTSSESFDVQVEENSSVNQLFAGWGKVPYYRDVVVKTGWVWVESIPAFAFKSIAWTPEANPNMSPNITNAVCAKAAGKTISNEFLSASVDKNGELLVTSTISDATSKIYRLGHYLEDVGDGGDTYNFDPIPGDKPIRANIIAVKVDKKGPLVASLLLTYQIRIPNSAQSITNLAKDKYSVYSTFANKDLEELTLLKRSAGSSAHTISTEVILKRGVPILFFETTWVNKAADHRLEVIFNTGKQIKTSIAESHFSLKPYPHGLQAKEKLPVPRGAEAAANRFPCQRFVLANEQIFLNSGLPEYAVEGSNLKLTLLRAVSFLSRPRLWTRGGSAGPNVAVPDANCLGINQVSYGWAPLTAANKDDQSAQAYALAEEYQGQLWATLGQTIAMASEGSLISLSNPAVRIVASYVGGAGQSVFVRLLNVTMNQQITKIYCNFGNKSIYECLLDETPSIKLSYRDKNIEVVFQANELKTIKIEL